MTLRQGARIFHRRPDRARPQLLARKNVRAAEHDDRRPHCREPRPARRRLEPSHQKFDGGRENIPRPRPRMKMAEEKADLRATCAILISGRTTIPERPVADRKDQQPARRPADFRHSENSKNSDTIRRRSLAVRPLVGAALESSTRTFRRARKIEIENNIPEVHLPAGMRVDKLRKFTGCST